MTGSDWRFVELDTGHWPMLSAERLTSLLLEVAADVSLTPAATRR